MAAMLTPHPDLACSDESVLVLIDCQERLWKVIHDAASLEARLGTLLRGARAIGVPLIVTEQNPAGLGATLQSLTEAAGDCPRLAKSTFSCGGEPTFNEALRATERGTVVLAGVEAHICVLQTALDLLARGFKVHVASECVGSRNPLHREAGLARLRDAGAVLTLTESLFFEWMRSTQHPAFRTIRDLVK